MLKIEPSDAAVILQRGGIIAYPTEAVYGLGCDPFNPTAVQSLIDLKGRAAAKGLILLIADWAQLTPLIQPLTEEQRTRVQATWPGFVTWVFPASSTLPIWLTKENHRIAIRMTEHPTAKALCAQSALISTSANLSGKPPAKQETEVRHQFPKGIDAIVQGELGHFTQPSPIYDVQNGKQLR